MLFKDGIRPEWEDAVNSTGGHFTYQLKAQNLLGIGTIAGRDVTPRDGDICEITRPQLGHIYRFLIVVFPMPFLCRREDDRTNV